ncbi:hypothetical protein E2P81_ATG00714 [Venturia nashicola]|uniref:Tat pathway signal sequence n=1 Tax=Venturia nashicola TaxID=86259 RepID=A0A4Z1PP39_9PEZI|nr:hypothetical protein E6O75_ATG00726 [Venturia nashicola]TLD39727.1 hypothetical protein E2P81_ATG00714 [Venturia nashicola]
MAAQPLLQESELSFDYHNDKEEDTNRPVWNANGASKNRRKWLPLLLAFFIGLSTGLLSSIVFFSTSSRKQSIASCLQQTSQPSPVLRDLEITYHEQLFNGSFFKETIYRQDGSPEVDAAWDELGANYRPLILPEKVGEEMGIPKNHVRVNPKYGGGYPVYIEATHQIHCVNLVRQGLYYNIDYYRNLKKGAFVNGEKVVKKHISHCLDMIRQQLMCTADLGVLSQVWWRSNETEVPHAFPDFNNKHTCKNFENIKKWYGDRQMPEDQPDDFTVLPEERDWIQIGIP